ncbi:DNA replication/repair protein RecF [Paracoccus sp. p4-l81]|uniref:DNA replication/repair protein RecF n=1 Tax=Paracoccus sp. p4-l81 TaxID=3342806 RepID=UPI0035BB8853
MLSGLTLTLFRSHRRLVLPLDGRPVAIWGSNGAGKTNILEAVSMLSPGRGLRRAAPEDLAMRGGPGWKITGLTASDEIETFAEGGARVVRVNGKAVSQVALGRLMRMVWLVPAMDRLWIEAAEGRRRFLDRLTLSFAPDHAEAVLAYDKAMRERNRLLRDDIRDDRWYGALEARMAEEGARIAANRAAALDRVLAAQQGAATAFPAADLAIETGEAQPAEALAAARDRDRAAGRTLEGPHRADLAAVYRAKAQPAALCSTGEQKALLISVVLANARALAAQTGAPPVLLLDEVAAHLDADRRAALYDEVCALGAQAFMTGTGAELFDGLQGRAQGFEVGEAGGVSGVVDQWRNP